MAQPTDLNSGLNALFGETPKQERPRVITPDEDDKVEYQHACVVVNREKMDKIREIARRENLSIKAVLEAVMGVAISAYESKYGVIVKEDADKPNLISMFK